VQVLAGLDLLRAGSRVLVPTARRLAPFTEMHGSRPFSSRVAELGGIATEVEAFALHPTDKEEMRVELAALDEANVDAVCLGSAEEVAALVQLRGTSGLGGAAVAAMGVEAAEACREHGLHVDMSLPAESEPQAVVEALEGHFGAGKLLW